MFVHQNQLAHLLRPAHYFDPDWYALELERILRPTWHLVGTKRELARHGDYITFDLLGEPVLVRNFHGELAALQNVCAHRFCKIRSEPRGHLERLTCQYHGWEYTKDGRTGRIPDAQSFRPWDRENACLKRFRVDTVGELVFVSLAAQGESLREYLGPVYQTWAEGFDGHTYRYLGRWENDFEVNWKLPCENSLESYHIPCVHPKTFVNYPPEADCQHLLDDRYTRFQTPVPRDLVRMQQNLLLRLIGAPITNRYTHMHIHPNLMFSSLDVYRMAMIVYPLGPTRCRYRVITYSIRGQRVNPLAWVASQILRPIIWLVARQIYREDAGLYPAIQQGVRAATHRGVIGTREERIYIFQRYILDRCQSPGSSRQALPMLDSPPQPLPMPAEAQATSEALVTQSASSGSLLQDG